MLCKLIKFDENQRIMMHVNVSKYESTCYVSLCSKLKLKSVQRWSHEIYVTTQVNDGDDNNDDDDINK